MTLFETWTLGPNTLKNRIVMAPMTRCRSGAERLPGPVVGEYYRQRASAGLIITEATVVTSEGIGYPNTPGIYNQAQINAWRKIVETVHGAGGTIFLQLWHCGRVSHPSFLPQKMIPVSASAVAIEGKHFTPEGVQPFPVPRALALDEIPRVIEHYKQGAQNAMTAGFDGVEIHGANGYLIDQFLRDGSNRRADAYGGSAENRTRFLREVTQAVISVWGKDRVGVRLSPSGMFNGMSDSDPADTFSTAIRALNKLGVIYVHLVECNDADVKQGGKTVETSVFRPLFKRTLILCGGFTQEKAEKVLAAHNADLIAFATLFIANPNLPKRMAEKIPLAVADTALYYSDTGAKGYTDYPA